VDTTVFSWTESLSEMELPDLHDDDSNTAPS
jgi:hypothetical protein